MSLRETKIQKTNGTCALCNRSFNKSAIKKHLESCIQKHPPKKKSPFPFPVEGKVFTILVEGSSFSHKYWLYLEVPSNSLLRRLDNFLRDTWVECCCHLSQFTIDGKRYVSELDEYFKGLNDKSMNYPLEKVLSVGKKFSYEYDFGSTTRLNLKVVSKRKVEDADSSILLLARNEPPFITCASCGKKAIYICRVCGYSGEGWVCDDCASEHECGEDMLLPVVNSPRVGVCGYTGND
jgi:predicted RNA-binding Zn-ribbon protein involved in translation (DUF1610 family)